MLLDDLPHHFRRHLIALGEQQEREEARVEDGWRERGVGSAEVGREECEVGPDKGPSGAGSEYGGHCRDVHFGFRGKDGEKDGGL